MKINNKVFGEWTEADLTVLIGNDIYRENNSIDYKVNFAPLEYSDKVQRRKKQNEFRNDVCAFANADGGYIFYGISETSGIANALLGISITNTDRFELDRRNELQSIQPVMPEIQFSFIKLKDKKNEEISDVDEEKYIVVISIERGLYKPYITEENEGEFHFFVRHGNRKQAMTYTEMRNDFLNAAMLSEDIKRFRKLRLEAYKAETDSPFALVHIIPATFKNPLDYIPMFELCKQEKLSFNQVFNGMIHGRAVPNVDGVYFPNYQEPQDYEQLQIFNSGVVELKISLEVIDSNTQYMRISIDRYLIIINLIEELEKLIKNTSDLYRILERQASMYVCVTIVGCKGLWNYTAHPYGLNAPTQVDRNEILCMPIEIKNILDEEQVKIAIEESIKMTKYSLGIRN